MSNAQEVQLADSYRVVSQRYHRSARFYVRGATLSGLAWASLLTGRIDEALRRPRVQVLLMHHLFPDENERFRMLLRSLSAGHEFISYSEAVHRILQGNIDKPYLTFTVDDGFKNDLRIAETLRDFGATACFFLCPSIIGESNPSEIRRFATERLRFLPIEFLSWKDVEVLQKQGHEIGSHTLSHSDIAQCTRDEAYVEINQSRDILRARCGAVEHFAWPFGRFSQFNDTGRELVFESQYISCASGERGCHTSSPGGLDPSQVCIRRDNVVAGWDSKHVLYFLARNVWRSSANDHRFPY